MPRINEAMDTDPSLILAGTSLKVIYPVRKNFLMGLKDSSNPAGSGGILCFIITVSYNYSIE